MDDGSPVCLQDDRCPSLAAPALEPEPNLQMYKDAIKRVRGLNERIAVLEEALRIVRQHPDFDDGGPMADMMDNVLEGKSHPMLDLMARIDAEGIATAPSAPPVPFPACPECGDTAILYECVACGATNYPADAKAPPPVVLSDEQLNEIYRLWNRVDGNSYAAMMRMVEAAHGIKQGGQHG